jgi:hypothetical protein
MHRNDRILALYAELREAIGADYTPRVMMTCAESLESLVNGSASESRFELRRGGVSIEERGVDRVFEEAGWALVRGGDWEDDPTVDYADLVDTRSMFASIERGCFL